VGGSTHLRPSEDRRLSGPVFWGTVDLVLSIIHTDANLGSRGLGGLLLRGRGKGKGKGLRGGKEKESGKGRGS